MIADVEVWLFRVIWIGMLALNLWALVDCVTRKAAAFPAAGKLTKPAWMLITAVALLVQGFLFGLIMFALIAVVAGLVYLTDVRPAVREVSGGQSSRW